MTLSSLRPANLLLMPRFVSQDLMPDGLLSQDVNAEFQFNIITKIEAMEATIRGWVEDILR